MRETVNEYFRDKVTLDELVPVVCRRAFVYDDGANKLEDVTRAIIH